MNVPLDLSWNWTQFCGPDGFYTWNISHDYIGSCFQELTLQIPILSLFAIVGAYYCGKQSEWILRTPRERKILLIRYITTFMLCILPIIRCTVEINMKSDSLYPVDIVLAAVQTFSWSVHFAFILCIRFYECEGLRGPTVVGSLWMLYFGFSFFYVRSQYFIFKYSDLHVTYFYFSVVNVVLLILYGLTMIPGDEHHAERLRHQNFLTQSINHQLLSSTYNRFHEDFDAEYLGTAMEDSGMFSKLFFCWVHPLMMKGLNEKIKSTDDLFDLPVSMASSCLYSELSEALARTSSIEVESEPSTTGYTQLPRPSLVRALHYCFGRQFYFCGLLKLISDIAQFCSPLLLYELVQFIEFGDKPMFHGYLYVSGLILTSLIGALCNEHFVFKMNEVSLKIRGSLITLIYKKTLNLSMLTLKSVSVGEIVNHISTDTDRIVGACASFHGFWSIPFQLSVTLYLLYLRLGVAAFAGVIFSLVLIPVNKFIADKIQSFSTKNMSQKDERVRLMSEILRGIRSIKLYTWEKVFLDKVKTARSEELYSLKWRKYLDAICVYFWATTPVTISMLTFSVYLMLGNELSAATIFSCMALLNMLIVQLNAFPWVLNGLMESWVSVKRIQNLLLQPESDLNAFYSHINQLKNPNEVVLIQNGNFSWQTQHFIMPNINLTVQKGQLTGISGPVGCGKSSLLMAICGEIQKHSGVVGLSPMELENGFGLVMQTAWLQNGSLRDNILFGKPYDEAFYKTVIEACALKEDLENLNGGDLFCVGEGGSTLSGGQKIRTTLARAVYQNKDVYLFDDVLASVDAHVATHIYHNCIQKLLLARGKTVVLATHLTKYLLSAHQIILMEKGCVLKQGVPSEVLPNYNDLIIGMNDSNSELLSFNSKSVEKTRRISRVSCTDGMVFEEEMEKGTLALNVYATYFLAVGRIMSVFVLLFITTMQLSRNGSDWWFSYWLAHMNDTQPDNGTLVSDDSHVVNSPYVLKSVSFIRRHLPLDIADNISNFLFIYCIIGTFNSITAFGRSFAFAIGGVRAATKIHDQLLSSIIKARVILFDISPIGRILNRFSSDVNTIDDSLPFILNILLASLFNVLGAMFIIVYSLPGLTFFLLPLIPFYHKLQNHYRNTSRVCKRLSSKSLSGLYSHFYETLQGLPTVRTFRAVSRFKRENGDKLENNQKAMLASVVIQNWLGLRLQMIGVFVIMGVGVIALIQHHSQVASPALIGLAISYALSLTSSLSSLVNSMTETEKEMVSVERVAEYININNEEDRLSTETLPNNWPPQGVVQFNNVQLRYRNDLGLSLKNVSFETLPAEKIGVVGRTGAGKSSLLVSLFRLTEVCEGTIYVDKKNIANIALSELRSRFFVIPQDPFLFSGTIRQNIDPTDRYRDSEIWTALQKCHLIPVVKKFGGLNANLTHEGNNLSNGQKQLMCLVRALLQNAKIVFVDEATSSVDQETDRLIQNTIRACFMHSTVFIIAHRIHSVMSCDRVLVMSDGRVVEFDSPQNLRQDKNSIFYSLVTQNDSSS